MSFRDFASTLREQASARAKEAAQKLQTLPTSLPTFDDMAANDEYIHSEEYNVRGQQQQWKKDKDLQQQQQHQLEEQKSSHFSYVEEHPNEPKSTTTSSSSPSSTHANNQVPETVSMSLGFGGDEASACTTESSWSLLDRPPAGGTAGITSQSRYDPLGLGWSNHERQHEGSSSQQQQQQQQRQENIASTNSRSLKKGSQSPTPLLSVVADTLQETPHRSNTTVHPDATHDAIPHLSQPQHIFTHDDDDDDDDDEDDPILSLMRQDPTFKGKTPTTMRAGRSTANAKPNPNRFMDDLENRMNTVEDVPSLSLVMVDTDGSDVQQNQSEGQQSTTTSTGVSGPFTKGPFRGYFLNLAVSSANRILNRQDEGNSGGNNNSSMKSPPLARERTKKTKANTGDDPFGDGGEYQVTSSTSVLANEDLARLQQLKKSVSGNYDFSVAAMLDKLHNNRRFVFIFCTFILSLVVYWYLSQIVRSDIT
jgi:hypothetical protein